MPCSSTLPTGAEVSRAKSHSDKLALLDKLFHSVMEDEEVVAAQVLADAVLVKEIVSVWLHSASSSSMIASKLLHALIDYQPETAASAVYSAHSARIMPQLVEWLGAELGHDDLFWGVSILCRLAADRTTAQAMWRDYPQVFPGALHVATECVRGNNPLLYNNDDELYAEGVTSSALTLVRYLVSPPGNLREAEPSMVKFVALVGETLLNSDDDSVWSPSSMPHVAMVTLCSLQQVFIETDDASSSSSSSPIMTAAYSPVVPALRKLLSSSSPVRDTSYNGYWLICGECVFCLVNLATKSGGGSSNGNKTCSCCSGGRHGAAAAGDIAAQFAEDDDLVGAVLSKVAALLAFYDGGESEYVKGDDEDAADTANSDLGPMVAERFRDHAVDFIAALARDRTQAQRVFSKHQTVLVPLLGRLLAEDISLLQQPQQQAPPPRRWSAQRDAAFTVVYRFSCAASNQAAMRQNTMLMSALHSRSLSKRASFAQLAILTRINLERQDSKPASVADTTNLVAVYRMLQSALSPVVDAAGITSHVQDQMNPALLALRYLSASKENRMLLWTGRCFGNPPPPPPRGFASYGGVLMEVLFKSVELAQFAATAGGRHRHNYLLDAIEDAFAVVVQLAGDEEPREAMLSRLDFVTQLVTKSASALEGTAAGKAGQLLRVRLKSSPQQPAAAMAANVAAAATAVVTPAD